MHSLTPWHWQQRFTPWKNPGIYHVTLAVTPREPILGALQIPTMNGTPNPEEATVVRSDLGRAVVECMALLEHFHPEMHLIKYCVMPDHLHFIVQVLKPMDISIKMALRGFQTGCRKEARRLGLDGAAIFSEPPYIRPLSRHGQLRIMFRYVEDNPRRLAVKQLFPGSFRTTRDIIIGEDHFDAVGNLLLLNASQYGTVHVRHELVDMVEVGNDGPLRAYMNGCILAARKGTILISPFVSRYEKAVLAELVKENLPVICLRENGFPPYYKPSGLIFDACAKGRVLLLAPQTYDKGAGRIRRAQCVAMNEEAVRIAQTLGTE